MTAKRRPNVLLIMADDHAPAAFSTYGSKLNRTPNLDRIAAEGLRLDRCFCTNAICTPARASVHTGKYSHTTGIKRSTTKSTRRRRRRWGCSCTGQAIRRRL